MSARKDAEHVVNIFKKEYWPDFKKRLKGMEFKNPPLTWSMVVAELSRFIYSEARHSDGEG